MKSNRSDLLRLMEVIQGYENLVEEYSKIKLYNRNMKFYDAIFQYELYLIDSAIEDFNGNKKLAAKSLNMNQKTFFNKLRKKKENNDKF